MNFVENTNTQQCNLVILQKKKKVNKYKRYIFRNKLFISKKKNIASLINSVDRDIILYMQLSDVRISNISFSVFFFLN
jgi:hypothetical protein